MTPDVRHRTAGRPTPGLDAPDPALETAAYFVVAEALTNHVAKAPNKRLLLPPVRGGLRHVRHPALWVTDDGGGVRCVLRMGTGSVA